jgi:hypothetical protein
MNSYDLAALHRDTFPGQEMTPDTVKLCIYQLMSLTSHIEEPTRCILVRTTAYDMVYRKFGGQEARNLRQLISDRFDAIYMSWDGVCFCGCRCCLQDCCYRWCGWTLFL